MLAVMDELSAGRPRFHETKRKEVSHRGLVLKRPLQVHLQVEIVEQVLHKVVNHVRLVALADTVHVDGMPWEEQRQPRVQRVDRHHPEDSAKEEKRVLSIINLPGNRFQLDQEGSATNGIIVDF